MKSAVASEQYRKVYIPMFKDEATEAASSSTSMTGVRCQLYIRRPPYWEGALAGERTLKDMVPLAAIRTTSQPTTCHHRMLSLAIVPFANT